MSKSLYYGMCQQGGEDIVATSNIKYGYLYNWYAINNANFAPSGWHVPTLADMEELLFFLDENYVAFDEINLEGSSLVAGRLLKQDGILYWNDPNDANNNSGFSAYGGGVRDIADYSWLSITGTYWINSEVEQYTDIFYGIYLYLENEYPDAYVYSYNKWIGMNVRLIKDDSNDPGSLTDLDGNVYETVKIGNQVWLKQNWACTKFSNGNIISNITDNSVWQTLESAAYCAYDDDLSNVFIDPPANISNVKYGYLYNWWVANDPDLPPEGWHLPTRAELTALNDYISGNGHELKETGDLYWLDYWGSTYGTNEHNFNARGSGIRNEYGSYGSFKISGIFPSSTEYLSDYFYDRALNYQYGTFGESQISKKIGTSIRFIKDDSNDPGSVSDYDENVYRTCKIGDQVWTADNWACTKLNDGTPISNVTNDASWAALTAGAYCAYNNDESNVFI